MPDEGPPPLRGRFEALAARLAAPAAAAADREPLKRDIADLYRAVEQELAGLTALREDLRGLIELWKSLGSTAPAAATAGQRSAAGKGAAADGLLAPAGGAPASRGTFSAGGAAAVAEGTPPGGSAPAAAPAPADSVAAPRFSPDRPVVQADHLGASTFIEKGWSRISAGDHVGAEESLRKALQLAPDNPQTESLLGWAQMLQGKYDDALLNFQKVLMREPANGLARINVGYICLKKGIFGEAIEHLSKAIRLENDRKATLYAHFYLGLVYLEREMYEDVQIFFQKTLALGPNLIEAHYELGRARWFAGQRDEALQAWREGFAANKFNQWGKRCAEMLQVVEKGGAPPRGG